MRSYFPIFILILLLIQNPAAQGEAADKTGRLDFYQALKTAFDFNPQMIEARQSLEAARGDIVTARTFQNPEAELEFGEGDAQLDSIEIIQPFDPFGVRFFEKQIAVNQVKIQDETLRSVWASVYLRVREIYSKIMLDQKRLELTKDNLNSMRQFFGRVQERYQSGQVFKNDLQRAKIELLQAEHDFLSAGKDLKTDQARLNLVLGRPMDTVFEIEETFKEEQLLLSLDQLKSIALDNRPDIKTAELELDSSNKNIKKERLNRLPSYSLGFKRTEENSEEDYAVLVGISLPLWNFNHGEVKKARAGQEIQATRTAAVREQALFEVYENFLEAELARKQFELSKKTLEEASELLRLADLRYSEGKIDFLNYLDQVKTVKQTKVNYYEGLFHLSRSLSALEASVQASLRQEDFFNEKF
ncbi:MAG: TolC family protein [Candidatus Omnitrophota bacterium]